MLRLGLIRWSDDDIESDTRDELKENKVALDIDVHDCYLICFSIIMNGKYIK